MQLIHSFSAMPGSVRGSVIALGNFDGLHLGHMAILNETLARAKALSAPAMVMTFEPHPRRFFAPHLPPLRLMRLKEKIESLRALGFDAVLMPRFDARLAATSAEDFICVLQDILAVRHVVTGRDFKFGTGRKGDAAMLASQPFGTSAIAPVMHDGEIISSSAIRAHLSEGNLAAANGLLGHPYTICGRVVHGDKRGRALGFPTANIPMQRLFLPRAGVYKVRIQYPETRSQIGVANIGVRPTFGGNKSQAEMHLFDFAGDLYGHYVRVELIRFLRDEIKFSSPDALKTQILRDIEMARL